MGTIFLVYVGMYVGMYVVMYVGMYVSMSVVMYVGMSVLCQINSIGGITWPTRMLKVILGGKN